MRDHNAQHICVIYAKGMKLRRIRHGLPIYGTVSFTNKFKITGGSTLKCVDFIFCLYSSSTVNMLHEAKIKFGSINVIKS